MKLTDGKEVRVRMENDSTKEMILRAVVGLGLWIACLYLLASKI